MTIQKTQYKIGQIVGWFDKGHLFWGIVTLVNNPYIDIEMENGEQIKLHVNRPVISTERIFTSPQVITSLVSFRTDITINQALLSIEHLWKKLTHVKRALSLDEILQSADLDNTDAARFALYLSLRENRHLFRSKGEFYVVLSKEESKAYLDRLKRQEQEKLFLIQFQEWLKQLINSDRFQEGKVFYPALDEQIKYRIEKELTSQPASKPLPWLVKMIHSLGEKAKYQEVYIIIRKALGQISDNTDMHLALSGLPVNFTPQQLNVADSLKTLMDDTQRLDLTHLNCWTVDSEDTLDIDDAISVERTNNGWQLGIHISDVASIVDIYSPLEEEASKRGQSIYLTNETVHMLPESISCDKASLIVGEKRPALSLLCDLDEKEQIVSYTVCLSFIHVKKRLTYAEFDQMLTFVEEICNSNNSDFKSFPSEFTVAYILKRVSEWHWEQRIRKGAHIVFDIDQTPARKVISELMVIYNYFLAKLSYQANIPLFYKCLENTEANDLPFNIHLTPTVSNSFSETINLSHWGKYTFSNTSEDLPENQKNFNQISNIKESDHWEEVSHIPFLAKEDTSYPTPIPPAVYKLEPLPHYTMGLDVYAQFTSPIRRYADLVNQRQVIAYFNKTEFPYSKDKLYSLVNHLNLTKQNIQQITYLSRQYHNRVRFLKECRDKKINAFVFKHTKEHTILSIPNFSCKIYIKPNRNLLIGSVYQITLIDIDPWTGKAKVRIKHNSA